MATRRVLLRGGWAYVSREALAPLVVAEFRANVSRVGPVCFCAHHCYSIGAVLAWR